MPIHVKVVSAEDYTKWVDGEKKLMAAKADDPAKVWTLDDLVKRGEKVYAANCAACHQPNGKGMPPAFPALAGSKVVLAPADQQLAVLLNGRPGTAMQSFAKLSNTEIAAVTTFTKNAFGNSTGTLVQPADVKAARK